MEIKVSKFDLESIDDNTLNNLVRDIENIDLVNGYSRADLESIENIISGAFTDIEEFDFREIPTGISKVNYMVISKRLDELRSEIGLGINNRYHTYLNMYGSLTAELSSISRLLEKHRDDTPSPLIDSLDSVYLFDGEYDSIKLTTFNFDNQTTFYNKVRLLRDSNLNEKITLFNYKVEDILGNLDCLIDTKREYRYSILKRALGVNDITYDRVIGIFSNSNDLDILINTVTADVLHVLVDLKDIIMWDYSNDTSHSRWVTSIAKLNRFNALASDKHSLKLLRLLALFRYYNSY